jgi:SAM-dependent methyltransferase
VTALADACEQESRRILAPLLTGDYEFRHVDEYNAVDFLLQILYPVPERMRPKRVLDFGAGYGRQMNLWSGVHDLSYVAVDAIELPYTLQSFYLSQFDLPVYEYVNGWRGNVGGKPGIYHLPTWRIDLLPDAFFDLVICTQVLQEIPATMVQRSIQTFRRCLKTGGALYIRDLGWLPKLCTVSTSILFFRRTGLRSSSDLTCATTYGARMTRTYPGTSMEFRGYSDGPIAGIRAHHKGYPSGSGIPCRKPTGDAEGLLHLLLNQLRDTAPRP